MRLNKRIKKRECRFYFPRFNAAEPKIIKEINSEYWTFAVKRNDQFVNHFNCILTIFWLANINIILYTDINIVINYIGKYYNKAKKSIELYINIIR